MREFTKELYEEFIKGIKSTDYKTYTIYQYLEKKPKNRVILLRHDVERTFKETWWMANLEHEYGIVSTYYVRKKPDVFLPDKLRKIASFGHEIGYHYETLDKANGDIEKALEIFESELKEFNKICTIKTISMHGNPLSSFINQDIWKNHDFKKFGIIGDGFLSIDFSNIFYITDTGRNWEFSKYNIKDFPPGYDVNRVPKIKSLLEVVDFVKEQKYPVFYFNLHPDVWASTSSDYYKKAIWQGVKNQGKRVIKRYRKSGK